MLLGWSEKERRNVNHVGIYASAAVLLCRTTMGPQTDKTLDITVQVLDGRNGKPIADRHVLVFTGLSSDAVKHTRSTQR